MRILLVFLFLMPGCLTAESVAPASQIRIAVDEWPPYQSRSYLYFGSAHRIITEAFAHQGIQVEYGWFPFARSLIYARNGDWDAAALSQKTPDKERYFLFSDPVMSAEKVFFHLKDQPFSWQKTQDLKPYELLGTLGYSYGEELDRAIERGELDMSLVAKNEQAFRMLLQKRATAFLFEKRAGLFLLQSEFTKYQDLFTYHPLPVQTVNFHVIFSKKVTSSEKMKRQFNLGLKHLSDQGLIDHYLNDGLSGVYTQ